MKAATNDLHSLSRGWGTLMANSNDIEALLLFLQQSEVLYPRPWNQDVLEMNGHQDSTCDIGFLLSSCRAWRRWIESYERRTHVQINLVSLSRKE
jgi:hypothetical protein